MSPLISLVIPTFNEEGNVTPLIESIDKALTGMNYEILMVDDGSTDGTRDELLSLSSKYPALRIIRLKTNFGQTAAMAAGIDMAKGAIVIPMDADLQNDPQDIPKMVAKMNEGYDVVSGWRKDRQDAFVNRRLPSMIANKIISTVTGVHLQDYGCTLKAYKKSFIGDIQLSGEMHRFLPAWCAWLGAKVTEVPVQHHPRTRGKSKYGIMRTFKVMIDLITLKFFSTYLSKPNYLFAGSGLAFFLLSVGSFGAAVFDKFGPDNFPKFRIPLLLIGIFCGLVALLLVAIGLLAELLGRIYFQLRQQKPYRLHDE